MDKFSIKTSIYDIFGYCIPGIVTLLYIYFIHNFNNLLFSANILSQLQQDFKLSISQWIVIFILSYIIGHLIATLSSLIIEKWLCCRLYKKVSTPKELFDEATYNQFNIKHNEIFGVPYSVKNSRMTFAYINEYYPNSYSTAFTFQTFYGMARNLCLIFIAIGLLFLFASIFCAFSICLTLLHFVIAGIFFYEYYRFVKYYNLQLMSTFLVPGSNTKSN